MIITAQSMSSYDENVFVNCPFDNEYRKIFLAILFAIHNCGFIAHCALEIRDAGKNRLEKIIKIISECKLGIHDISRTELDPKYKLPRFNMPLELGIFIGAAKFGKSRQCQKNCLILDKRKYCYQKYCSDLSGHDIEYHDDKPQKAIRIVRDWLQTNNKNKKEMIPSGSILADRYEIFQKEIPLICKKIQLNHNELTFDDYLFVIFKWLETNKSN